jgi:hypothetical protein
MVGDSSRFAIESGITEAYASPGQLALGFFLIHIKGQSYGVREPDASLLAVSFDEVDRRIKRRGTHTASFSQELGAGEIADAFRDADYNINPASSWYLGLDLKQFSQALSRGSIVWAPDGDEAFDDGSYVLQFDIGDEVRMIAFRCLSSGFHDPRTLSDVTLSAQEFYGVLVRWRHPFSSAWANHPKAGDKDDLSTQATTPIATTYATISHQPKNRPSTSLPASVSRNASSAGACTSLKNSTPTEITPAIEAFRPTLIRGTATQTNQ